MRVHPEYYDDDVAQAAPAGAHLLRLGTVTPAGVKVSATRASDGLIHVVVINKRLAGSQFLRLRVAGAHGAAEVEQLRASSVHATGGVTIGGQTFGDETSTGVLAGPASHRTVTSSSGGYPITVPAASATMLTLPAGIARRSAISGGIDLAAYLERMVGYPRRRPGRLHRAHVTSIPFENLDSHGGVPVSVELDDIQRKLVVERRGGYCFEHNLLLAGALGASGISAEPMLARVRIGRPPGTPRPRTHLVHRVQHEGEVWLADVGFGNGTLLEPIPFGPGAEYEQSGWRFRLVQDGSEHVLQTAHGTGWVDVYGFVPDPVPFIDIQTSNWFTCTHPSSPFVAGLIVAINQPDGTRVTLSDRRGLMLTTDTPAERTESEVSWPEVPGLLENVFRLPGFALGDNGRITRPPTR